MKFRLSLLNMLLLIGALAAWTAVWVQSREIERFESRIPGLQNAARELVVTDTKRLTTVKPHPKWYGEESWLINVPETGKYQLNMVADEIGQLGSNVKTRQAEHQYGLAPGKHRIEFKDSQVESGEWLLEVLVDDQVKLKIRKPADWKPESRSAASTTDVGECKAHTKPVCNLIVRKIMPSGATNISDTSNGYHVWIEKE